MKKAIVATLFAVCTASPALAADVNINDGDSIKITASTGLAGSMRFIAKEIAPGSYVDIPMNEGHVQFTLRGRGNSGLVSFTQTFASNIISTPMYVATAPHLLSGVYIDRSVAGVLRISNPSSTGRNVLVAGYILAF